MTSTSTDSKPSLNDPRLPARFWNKVKVDETSGCWLWTAATSAGYGHIGVGPATAGMIKAHRLAYLTLVGPVPDGLELDHLCRNRRCCNPAHLEPVSHRENILRSSAMFNGAHNRIKTHCPRGHEYAGDNLLVSCGRRLCRECRRQRQTRAA